MDTCLAGSFFRKAGSKDYSKGRAVFIAACRRNQTTGDGDFMHYTVAPILRTLAEKITNKKFFKKIKRNYRAMRLKANAVFRAQEEDKKEYYLEE
ncbi:hypothetical protein OROGR_018930 [Orobanche gracilis]